MEGHQRGKWRSSLPQSEMKVNLLEDNCLVEKGEHQKEIQKASYQMEVDSWLAEVGAHQTKNL